MKFMQNPLIQKIVLLLAILFVLDIGYKLFLEKSYYLQSAGQGTLYRINKKTGEVYLIEGKGMYPVLDFKKSKSATKYFSLYEIGYFTGKQLLALHLLGDAYESEIDVDLFFPCEFVGALVLVSYFGSIFLCLFFAKKKGKSLLFWLIMAILFTWIATLSLFFTKTKVDTHVPKISE